DAALKARVTATAAEALAHEAPDVQAAVLDLLERHGDPADRHLAGQLQLKLDGLAASQRPRLLAWLGSPAPTVEAAPAKTADGDVKALLQRAAKVNRALAR